MSQIYDNTSFKKLLLVLIILFVVCFIIMKFNLTFVDFVKNASEEIIGYNW